MGVEKKIEVYAGYDPEGSEGFVEVRLKGSVQMRLTPCDARALGEMMIEAATAGAFAEMMSDIVPEIEDEQLGELVTVFRELRRGATPETEVASIATLRRPILSA